MIGQTTNPTGTDRTQTLCDILSERLRQEVKFPEQHLPNVQTPYQPRFVAGAMAARQWVDSSAQHGRLSWTDVLVEEVAEAIDEAEAGRVDALRVELIQVAAVCVRWVEDIDRADREPVA